MNHTQDTLRHKLSEGALLVDVRTVPEYNDEHHPAAVNIPAEDTAHRLAEYGDRSRPVILYCVSGARSAGAADILTGAGYTDVINAGGIWDLPDYEARTPRPSCGG